MFSAIDVNSIMSLLYRFRIQNLLFVFRAVKNSTISFQDCLGALVRHCLVFPPSGIASHSSYSNSQSLLISWRVLIQGNMCMCLVLVSSISSVGALCLESPKLPRLLSFCKRSSSLSVASAFRKIHSDRSAGDQSRLVGVVPSSACIIPRGIGLSL